MVANVNLVESRIFNYHEKENLHFHNISVDIRHGYLQPFSDIIVVSRVLEFRFLHRH